jgi:protein TonB
MNTVVNAEVASVPVQFASFPGDRSVSVPGTYRASLILSALLHAGLIVVCAMMSVRLATPPSAPIPVTIRDPAPPLPAGTSVAVPDAQVSQPAPEARRSEHKPARPKIGKRPRSSSEAAPPPVAAPAVATNAGGEGGVAGGVPGGVAGGTVGGTGDRLLREDELGTPLTVLSKALPRYPALARARGIEGLVVLEGIVDREGRVEAQQLKVVQSVPLLDSAAIDALRRWRFKPVRDAHGQLARVVFQVPIRFRLR